MHLFLFNFQASEKANKSCATCALFSRVLEKKKYNWFSFFERLKCLKSNFKFVLHIDLVNKT